MCPVAEAKLFFCNSFPHQQLIFRVSCGAAGSLTVNVFTQMQMDRFNIYFVEHPDNFETLWNQEWHSLSTNFQGQWCCTWVSDCMCWLNWPKCREREFFYNFSYSWFFYQPGGREEGSVFLRFFHIYEFLSARCQGREVFGKQMSLIPVSWAAPPPPYPAAAWFTQCCTPPVNHQWTCCSAEGAFIAVCSAMLNRALMHCTVILQCNTLKYCTALFGVKVVV